MSLESLLNLSNAQINKIGISEERIEAVKPQIRQYIAFWREYPDLFVDFMQTGGDPDKQVTFRLFFYQRCFLRVATRYKYVYAVYPRAYSKSFLSVMVLMIRAILFPGAHLFSTAGGKEQAAQILMEKVADICAKIPSFGKEIDRTRGATREGRDYCKFVFKNGSTIENLAARESSRGRRFHGGLMEECVGLDQKILQEVVIPTMNVSRRCLDGTVQQDEVLNQSQIFITTAGYKGTFSYNKLIQTLVVMITEPEKAFIMGGTYRVPLINGLLPKTFVSDLRKDSTFNEASFEREYESKWTGTVEGAFFNGEKFDRNRIIQKAEPEASSRISKNGYYVLAVDVGRRGCQSIITVFKVTPQPQGRAIKALVNIYDMNDVHFEYQARTIKKIFYKYNARRVVIDGNGAGIGLIDFMVRPQIEENGDIIPDFGIYNDPDGFYKQFRTKDCEYDAIYIIKATAPLNTEAHSITQSSLETGKVKFLISERDAKSKLMGTKVGQNMTPEERDAYLKPYKLTDILKEEMMNLREENEGINIILKQANRKINKDKFSSLEYGLYYINQEEDTKRKKRKFVASEWQFFS